MKIVAIYTGQGLSEMLNALFKKEIPAIELTNIIDDSIIHDVITAGGVTKPVIRRLLNYYTIAQTMQPDYILNTCSSVGEVVNMGKQIIDTPIIRIDEPMAEVAVKKYTRIGILATLSTTLEPTMRLLKTKAEQMNQEIKTINGLAQGAYQALVDGQPQKHDELLKNTALTIADKVECIVLAQGSMMRMQDELKRITGKPVLSSPLCCIDYIKTVIK